MAAVETIRELDDWIGKAVLVKRGNEHFVVSSVNALFSGPETLVFPADESGEVESYIEVAGGRCVSRADAIRELEEADHA